MLLEPCARPASACQALCLLLLLPVWLYNYNNNRNSNNCSSNIVSSSSSSSSNSRAVVCIIVRQHEGGRRTSKQQQDVEAAAMAAVGNNTQPTRTGNFAYAFGFDFDTFKQAAPPGSPLLPRIHALVCCISLLPDCKQVCHKCIL